MFILDAVARDHSRKRKFTELGNTSTDPFGFDANVTAFHRRDPTTLYPDNIRNLLSTPFKSFTSLLLDGICGDEDDDVDEHEDDKNLNVLKKKFKGQVTPLDHLMESEKTILHTLKNESYGLWSSVIIHAAEKVEEKDAEMKKLLHDYCEIEKQLVGYKLETELLKKKTRMAEKKIKSLKKTLKEVISRPGEGQEDEGESSFVGTQRHEAAWLSCKVCDIRIANMIVCPCKHLSVCRRCDDTITKCPICKTAKISSVEVCLP